MVLKDRSISDPKRALPLRSDWLRPLARRAEFDLCGVTDARPAEQSARRFERWIDLGYHGSMRWIERWRDPRRDPNMVLDGVRSIICLGKFYHVDRPKSIDPSIAGQAWISRYGWGQDYHDVIRRRMSEFAAAVKEALAPRLIRTRGCVDTAPLPERELAARAGLGWIGKNGALIHPERGSYLVLAELLTDVECVPDKPIDERCGECDRCVRACPGNAIVEAGVIDARKCASYLTIEHPEPFAESEKVSIGRNLFGCDVCQDVCPYNRAPETTDDPAFEPSPGRFAPAIANLEKITPDSFKREFKNSPILRIGYERFVRNLTTVQENLESSSMLEIDKTNDGNDAGG